MAWEQDLINEIKGLREDIYNGVLNTNGSKGGSSIRRYSHVSPDDVESIDELLERYRHKETEIERFNKLKEIKQESEAFFISHKDALDEILRKRKENIDLTEDEIELEEEYIRQNGRYADSIYQLGDDNKFSVISRQLTNIQGKVKGIYGEIEKLTDPWAKADHAASQYAKTVGLAKKGMDALRNETLKSLTQKNIAAKFNINAEELIEAQSNYVKGIGRNVRLSTADQENMAAMRAVTGTKGTELAALYENFGVNMSNTADHVGRMFSEASQEGILFEKYAENVSKNIKIAQNYTFTNGLKGLESMAKKATALKLDMQQVAALADKVSTVEGAIGVSAKLQVLGGPFASLADPMGMLNEGLNDMEGLQDRLITMIGGMGNFDQATGEVKVSAFNKARLRAAAEAMGISYDNIMESVNAQAKRGEIENQIKASATASALPEEMKELIKNSGTFVDGKAGVSIRGQFKSLNELSGEDYEALKKETQTESQDIKDIAMDVRSIKDARDGIGKSFNSWMGRMFSLIGGGLKAILKGIGGAMAIIGPIAAAFVGIKSALNIGGTIKSLFGRGSMSMEGSGNAIGGGFLGNAKAKISNVFRRSVAGGTSKVATGAASTATKKVAGTTFKNRIKSAGTKTLIKTLGKSGARTALKLGAGLAKGMAVGGPLGIVGAIGDIATDSLVASGKMKKGGTGHHLAKGASGAASGAALGAMIGSVIPGVGTAIGAVVGAIGGAAVGLIKAGKAKQERILEEKLSGTGITVQGKYNRSKLKKINKALETGEISNRMRRKLENRGDIALLDQIDDVKAKREAKALERTKNLKDKSDVSKTNFGTANISVNVANFSGKGFSNLFDDNGNGTIKASKEKNNTFIKPTRLENGKSGSWEVIQEKKTGLENIQAQYSTPKDFNININGSLKLTGENGQSVDIISELRKNPQMLRSLADMISKEISYLDKGTNVI